MKSVLVTAYENPDLDGTACAFAYAEFLNKMGVSATAVSFGKPEREAQFVFSMFSIPHMQPGEKLTSPQSEFVIVDASDPHGLSDQIDLRKVKEIIDHRKMHEMKYFPNATAQIELVGAAATLIAEKFYSAGIGISMHAAALLYSAIVSNTINFKAKVTTDRDKNMASWLLTKFTLPNNYVHDMFAYKSRFTRSLIDMMRAELATSFGGFPLAISQLEIVDAQQFVTEKFDEIQTALQTILAEKKPEYLFLTCIDIEKGFNIIVCNQEKTKVLIEQALHIKFSQDIARTQAIIMRKEMVPLLVNELSKGMKKD